MCVCVNIIRLPPPPPNSPFTCQEGHEQKKPRRAEKNLPLFNSLASRMSSSERTLCLSRTRLSPVRQPPSFSSVLFSVPLISHVSLSRCPCFLFLFSLFFSRAPHNVLSGREGLTPSPLSITETLANHSVCGLVCVSVCEKEGG